MTEMGHIDEQAAARALRALPVDEEAQVDRHAAICAPCDRLLQDAHEAAQMLALVARPALPPVECKQRLMARIERETFLARPTHRRAAMSLRWAAGALMAGLLVWNLQLHRELSHRRMLERMVAADPQPSPLKNEDPTATTVRAQVYTQPDGSGALLIVENLAPAPPGMVYQIWVADEQRQEPMETFQAATTTQWLVMRAHEPLTRFKWVMITLEHGPNNAAPTGKPLLRGDL